MEIDLDQGGSAHPAECLFLDRAQQFGLGIHSHGGDLIQEQDAAVGHFHQAFLAFFGAGVGTRLITEQLAFQDGGLDGSAVDGHVGFVGARTVLVNETGQDVLAGAGFAGDQDGGGNGRRPLSLGDDREHGG